MSCPHKYSRLSSITLRKAPPTLPKDQRALLDWSQGLAMCNEKGQTKYKPDFFATIFLITTSGQVSRARRLEAAHHYQHHVPSSGSQISNMDHLIILFFFTDGNWIPRHERVHSAIPRGLLQFP